MTLIEKGEKMKMVVGGGEDAGMHYLTCLANHKLHKNEHNIPAKN